MKYSYRLHGRDILSCPLLAIVDAHHVSDTNSEAHHASVYKPKSMHGLLFMARPTGGSCSLRFIPRTFQCFSDSIRIGERVLQIAGIVKQGAF
jgi:hypothetical protein